MTNQTSNIIKIVVLIFAVLGVAVAAFFIVKKLTERKASKDDSLFDELDELDIDDECCCCCDDECDELADAIEEAAEEI